MWANDSNRGAAEIELYGGKSGKVPFPHLRHQESLKDCTICHATFPQESGSIERLKQEGKLKRKYVMKQLCTNCHKQTKKSGKKSGPTSCKTCHHKNKES